jgi:dTDP-4-dehydrorhamnose reductase
MKIVLFGKNGQLGREFQKTLHQLGRTTCIDRNDLELSDIQALRTVLDELKPGLIINASAYTAVDRAESENEKAMEVNARAPGIMAEWARDARSVFIHYSTDYVFDGTKGSPYIESDPPNPLNVYGKSKLAGEENIIQAGGAYLILRTSWVYSVGGTGFVNKVLEWSRRNEALKIVKDQTANPTWAYDLGGVTYQALFENQASLYDTIREKRGVYHLAGSGFTSRFEWAKQILVCDPNPTEQRVRSIEPASSEEFPTPARRPSFTALNCTKFEETFNKTMPDWKISLQKAMNQ